MANAVHFGAGSIGRGFVGQLLWEAGCRTTFVDVKPALVNGLNAHGSYLLRLVGADGSARSITVGNVCALLVMDADAVRDALADADLISTAVSVAALPRIAPLLAAGVNARAAAGAGPINILLCENGWHIADALRALMLPHIAPKAQNYFHASVGRVDCVIGRMVPVPSPATRREDALLVVAEDYTELPVNAAALRAPLPPLPGLALAKDFDAYEARKLFLHNMGHAALAYAGWRAGHEFIWQCAEDADVAGLCRAAMNETEAALIAEYGFAPAALSEFAEDLMRRFFNKALGDTVARVAADPLRKLGPDDRLVGAARLCEKHALPTDALARVIACALCYDNSDDPAAVQLQQMRQAQGDDAVLETVCGIPCGSALAQAIARNLGKETHD